MSENPREGRLTEEAIRNSLSTYNEQVIKDLYSLVLSLYRDEGDRSKSLDTKSASLFGLVGAFISAIFVILGFLTDSKNIKISELLSGAPSYLILGVLGFLGFALVSLFYSVRVTAKWKAPGEIDLFQGNFNARQPQR